MITYEKILAISLVVALFLFYITIPTIIRYSIYRKITGNNICESIGYNYVEHGINNTIICRKMVDFDMNSGEYIYRYKEVQR